MPTGLTRLRTAWNNRAGEALRGRDAYRHVVNVNLM